MECHVGNIALLVIEYLCYLATLQRGVARIKTTIGIYTNIDQPSSKFAALNTAMSPLLL